MPYLLMNVSFGVLKQTSYLDAGLVTDAAVRPIVIVLRPVLGVTAKFRTSEVAT